MSRYIVYRHEMEPPSSTSLFCTFCIDQTSIYHATLSEHEEQAPRVTRFTTHWRTMPFRPYTISLLPITS